MPLFQGLCLEFARQVHDVGLAPQQHGQPCRILAGDADLQFLESRLFAAPVVVDPLEGDGLSQLAV